MQGFQSPARPADLPGWLITHRELFSLRAPGNTCVSALRKITALDVPAANSSKGCGGVMRVAPVGMFMAHLIPHGDAEVAATFKMGSDTAAITHGHPSGYLTAGVLAVVVALVLNDVPLAESIAKAKDELRKHAHHEETLNAIEAAEGRALSTPGSPAVIRKLGEGWVARKRWRFPSTAR